MFFCGRTRSAVHHLVARNVLWLDQLHVVDGNKGWAKCLHFLQKYFSPKQEAEAQIFPFLGFRSPQGGNLKNISSPISMVNLPFVFLFAILCE